MLTTFTHWLDAWLADDACQDMPPTGFICNSGRWPNAAGWGAALRAIDKAWPCCQDKGLPSRAPTMTPLCFVLMPFGKNPPPMAGWWILTRCTVS